MYEELILKLREDAEFLEISSKYNNTKNEFAGRISQAADAIEKLSMRIHGDEAAIAGMKREIERMVVADKPRWIPVTERLPEEIGHYLAYFVAGDFEQIAWIEITFFWKRFSWEHKFGEEYREKITHWMPLPEPPRDGES